MRLTSLSPASRSTRRCLLIVDGVVPSSVESSWAVIPSSDTDGSALIGHGVVPDVTLLPRQSDLVAGKDTLFEAALAWVRQELKP